jgi:hypothetical protein
MTLWVCSVENGCQAKGLIIFRQEQIAEEFYNPHINISRDKTQVSESNVTRRPIIIVLTLAFALHT